MSIVALLDLGKSRCSLENIVFGNFVRGIERSHLGKWNQCLKGIWQTDYLTHAELVEMASDTTRVIERAVEVEESEVPDVPTKPMLLPGFPCPLCRFPTYTWLKIWTKIWKVLF